MNGRAEGLHCDEIEALVGRAIEAPSSHNTQPWRFRVRGAEIALLADPTRALPVNDPDDRELAISCGCALFNLRVAAAAAGFGADVELLPDDGDDELVARVRLQRSAASPDPCGRLLPAIGKRRTYRKAFLERPVPDDTVATLAQSARDEGATLVVVEGAARKTGLASLVAEADAALWADPRWRRELAVWMHPRRSRDGLAVPGLALHVAQAVVRTFDLGGGVAASDRKLADASPLIVVVATATDGRRDRVVAGLALEHVLLEATSLGLQASYLNQPVQVPSIRARLAESLGIPGCPQIVARFGYPGDVLRPTPRRPLPDVLE